MQRRFSSTQFTAVFNVVDNQRSIVHNLANGHEINDIFGLFAQSFGHQQQQHWSPTFAAYNVTRLKS